MATSAITSRARALSPPRLDLLLALVITVVLVAYTWAVNGANPASAAATALILVMGAGISWRRRAPLTAGVAIAAAAGLYEPMTDEVSGAPVLAPLLLGFYSMAAYAPLGRSAVGLGAGLALTFLSFLEETRSFGAWLENVVFAGLVAGSVWAGGVVVRVNRDRAQQLAKLAAQLEREREEKARLAVAAERVRIARELHDVVAHSVSVIAVQAGAGRHTLEADPQLTHEKFRAIESTARQALIEMRRLLGLLREGGEPATAAPLPGIESHAELIEQARGAGLSVRLDVEGKPRALSAGIDLAAYRVLQEALTNTRKHAPSADAAVRIRYASDALEIEVRDDGAGAAVDETNAERGGFGLIGMRERVALYRGELEAGPLPDGGFRVKARLPLGEDRA